MLELKIGSKNYKIEYSVEAALYGDCVEKVAEFYTKGSAKNDKEAIKNFVSQLSNLPQLVLSAFYAGLMEHHGENGDKTVLSVDDAKALLTKLIKDNNGKELGDFYGVIGILMGQMAVDGFFEMIGLERIIDNLIQTAETLEKTTKNQKKKVSQVSTI